MDNFQQVQNMHVDHVQKKVKILLLLPQLHYGIINYYYFRTLISILISVKSTVELLKRIAIKVRIG